MIKTAINFLKSIISHKSLFNAFLLREIKGKFAGSIGGFIWLLITPLCNILVYIFVFGYILKIKLSAHVTGTENFGVFLLSGIFLWLAFSESILQSLNVLINNSNIITKVYFPVNILPVTIVSSGFIINLLGLVLFLIYLLFNNFLSIYWLSLPIYIFLLYFFTIGLASILSALTVFIRDLQQFINIILFVWFYATPIIYPVNMIPVKFQKLLILNPIFPFIEGFKISLLKCSINYNYLLLSIFWTIFMYLFGTFIFEKLKNSFADVL